jgi:hypothetical protein
MPVDVFEEDAKRLDLADDAGDLRPEMARVFRALTLAGDRKRLAGITGSDEMNFLTPWSAVKGSKVRPNRRDVEATVRKTRCQRFAGSDFVFHVADRASSWMSQPEAKTDSAVTGAELDGV